MLRTLKEKLSYQDLGLHGSRKALRGTLGVLIAFILLGKITDHFLISKTLPFLGVIVAMMGSLVINDIKIRDQKITTLLLFLPASFATTLSILLSFKPILQVVVFILITFFAIYARKYGLRGMGLGMIGYMSYFCPLFFHMHTESILWAILFHGISVFIVYAMRFWILPERPQKMMSLYLKTFSHIEERIQKKLIQDQSVRDDMLKLNELILLIENFLNSVDDKKLHEKPDSLQMKLFEREVSLQLALYERDKYKIRNEVKERKTKNSKRPLTSKKNKLHFQTKQALQATLATAISSAIGFSLSHERWYWASITAFIIFTGSSRGENFMRAFVRLLGTLMGLVAGFFVAYLVKGQTSVEWGLILVCIYIGLYTSRISFGFWTATAFTLMLAFLFDIMGMLTTEILILRLEETAIGAIVGGIVALYVLSTRTTSLVRENLISLLEKMMAVMEVLPFECNTITKKELIKLLRQMDQDLINLRNASLPLINKFNFTSDQNVKDLLFYSMALSYYVRQIATMKRKESDNLDDIIKRCEELKLALQIVHQNFLEHASSDQEPEKVIDKRSEISLVFSRAHFFTSEIKKLA